MRKYLISKGAIIYFSTEMKIQNGKIKYFQKNKEIFFNKKSVKKIFYCLSSVFLIKDLSKNHFEKLNNYKKYAINCLIKIEDKDFKNNFNEILCLNKKIYFVNRFYFLNY